jgi:hypothetical protein
MKNLTFKIIALAAVLGCAGKAAASDFGLEGFGAADVRSSMADIKAPAAPQAEADDLIGVDMAVRIPFKTLKKAVTMMAASEKRLTIVDAAAPVVTRAGELMKIFNLRVDVGGIIVEPTLTLKPYLEGRDRLAIRVQRVQLHASMQPDVKAAPAAQFDQETMMAQVMDVMIKGVYSSLNETLKAKHLNMKAEQIITLNYDKTAWTLHAKVSSQVLYQFIPAGLVGDIHLTGFALTDTGITMKIATAE